MTWLIYSRVSRVGSRKDTLISPEVQQTRGLTFAEGRGWDAEVLPPELDVSGGKVRRPVLEQAIERIEAGTAEGLIVAQLDRLSRMAMSDALSTLERIESAGGQVIAVAENIDATTPEGRMARNMFLSMAAMQRERYGEHIATSKRRAVEQGIWPTSTLPRGYAKGRDRRLVPDPRVAPKVKRAFEMRAGGASWNEVAEHLGCSPTGARKTVMNEVYLGRVALTVEGERVVNLTAHEPIVTRRLWEAAQIDHPKPARGVHEAPALLAGVIRCAACSRLMSRGDGRYRCFPRKATGVCPRPALISIANVDEFVDAMVRPQLERMEAAGRSMTSTEVEAAALAAAEDELAQWREAIKIADVGVEHVAGELRTLAGNVEAAQQALARAQAASSQADDAASAAEVYDQLSVGGKRHVLRRAIGAVWVAKGREPVAERVRVVAAGFEPSNLSRPGNPVPPVAVDFSNLPGEIRPLGG